MGGTVSRIGFSKSKFKFSSSKSLSGKTVIVTGANTGVGFETALDLTKRNGRIILACRNREKGEVAKSRIIQLTGNTNVVFKQLDMSLMSSIRDFVSIISTEEKAVDILINNAGVVSKYSSDLKSLLPVIARLDCIFIFPYKKVPVIDFQVPVLGMLLPLFFLDWNENITAEGFENTFATNYYGPFLLTTLLLGIKTFL